MKQILFPLMFSAIIVFHFAMLDSTGIEANEMRRLVVEVTLYHKTHKGLYHFMQSGKYGENITVNGIEMPQSTILLWCQKKEEETQNPKLK